ncbi:MAG: hypothetical protein ACRD4E_07755 [Bryobacteraceae bacterium]
MRARLKRLRGSQFATVIGSGTLVIEPKISSTRALVADVAALSRLLSEVPEAQDIRPQLCKPFFARRWQQVAQRSFWIGSDGHTVVCLTLTGLDLDEMVAIWVAFDTYRSKPGFTLTASSLSEMIEAELGVAVEFEN